jgi:hypothetical protein
MEILGKWERDPYGSIVKFSSLSLAVLHDPFLFELYGVRVVQIWLHPEEILDLCLPLVLGVGVEITDTKALNIPNLM